ncbi:glycosyltransferase, partial [Patescibacteria group bacterium]
MKILHVNKFHYPKRGADRYYLDLMRLLEKHGHQNVPFSMEHPKNEKSDFKNYFVSQVNFENPTTIIEKMRVLGRMMYSFEAKKKIQELLKENNVDVVHINNIYHQISPSILSAIKKANKPIVMTVHDYKLMCPNYKMFTQDAICERCKKRKFYKAIRYRCMRKKVLPSVLIAKEMYFHKALRIYE